jgi:hypothetical protein
MGDTAIDGIANLEDDMLEELAGPFGSTETFGALRFSPFSC